MAYNRRTTLCRDIVGHRDRGRTARPSGIVGTSACPPARNYGRRCRTGGKARVVSGLLGVCVSASRRLVALATPSRARVLGHGSVPVDVHGSPIPSRTGERDPAPATPRTAGVGPAASWTRRCMADGRGSGTSRSARREWDPDATAQVTLPPRCLLDRARRAQRRRSDSEATNVEPARQEARRVVSQPRSAAGTPPRA
jgi:hypothetical protein